MGLIRYFLYCILLINGLLHTSRLKTMMYVNAAPGDIEGMFTFINLTQLLCKRQYPMIEAL